MRLSDGWLDTQDRVLLPGTTRPPGETAALTHDVLDADGVPALHDGQEGDEGGNDPAAANHQSHSHGRHLVAVDQGLTADGVVPAHKPPGMKVMEKTQRA